MGTIMIFLRMRRPGADGARREPARMGRRRASRRRVDVGRDVRRRDRAVRVVLDAMLAAQERARDLAINIVVEAALRRRRRRRGRKSPPARAARPSPTGRRAVRECVEGSNSRLQFFRPLDPRVRRGPSGPARARSPAAPARAIFSLHFTDPTIGWRWSATGGRRAARARRVSRREARRRVSGRCARAHAHQLKGACRIAARARARTRARWRPPADHLLAPGP